MRIAKGLQQADLSALSRYQAGEHHVAQKRGDTQEDGRQDRRHRLDLVDLVHDEPV